MRLWALIPTLALVGLAGVGAGLFGGGQVHIHFGSQIAPAPAPSPTLTSPAAAKDPGQDIVIYQCGMHNPPYEQAGPGNCPLCGMVLQQVHVHRTLGADVIIDPSMVQNMGVRTATPIMGTLQSTIRAVGTLAEPEQNHREINLRVDGWITKLYADKEGLMVAKGDPLFEIASPMLTQAGDELIRERYKLDLAKSLLEKQSEGATPETAGTLTRAAKTGVELAEYNTFLARRKVQLMGLSDEDVAAIEKSDKAPQTITIKSPIHGHIAEKRIIEGSAVKAGDELMRIADRSTMWLIAQVFEQQLGQVKVGQSVTTEIDAAPGKTFTGKVDFIYPHLDPSTRTAQVRVIIDNADHSLHENMFAKAQIQTADSADPVKILVPRDAVLDSGQRQVVFLSKGEGHFELREVKVGRTGPMASATTEDAARYIEILKGLTADDTVVTSGQFLLDSESRLEEARRKLLRPGADQPAGGMPGMDMPGMDH